MCEQMFLNLHNSREPRILEGIPARRIVDETADSVINFPYPIWDEKDRHSLNCLILNHYYMREIGLETVAFWKHMLYNKLNERMPYYIKLWNAEKEMGNIFATVSLEDIMHRNGTDDFIDTSHADEDGSSENGMTGTDNTDGNTTENSDSRQTGNSNTNDILRNSMTPQNGLTSVIQGNYLTEANVNDSVTTTEGSLESAATGESSSDFTTRRDNEGSFHTDRDSRLQHDRDYTENRTNTREGFNGVKPEILLKYQASLINIVERIIMDCAPLFMGILG